MKIKTLLASFLIALSAVVSAGTTEGVVNQVFVHANDDKVLFSMQTEQSNFAECATTKRYVVSTDTQKGKNIYSAILTAKASNQTITVFGKEECTIHHDSENIRFVVLK